MRQVAPHRYLRLWAFVLSACYDTGMAKPFVIFLHSAAYDRVFQAASLLLTASSAGQPGHLFLFYGALAGYMNGEWDDPATIVDAGEAAWRRTLSRSFETADTPSPLEMLDMARRAEGGLTVTACSTSIRMLGLDTAAVKARVDHIAGLHAMIEIAADAQPALYI